MRRTVHRKDGNHNEAYRALFRVTWVHDIHNYGGGMGDLLARHLVTKEPVFIEMKPGDAPKAQHRRTPAEESFAEAFPRHSVLCLSVDDALRAVGARL